MSADFHWLTSDEVRQARELWNGCVDNQLYGLINELSEASGFSIAQLTGLGKSRPLTRARFLGYAICRKRGYSLPQIAKAFHRDHTTILHGLRVHEREQA